MSQNVEKKKNGLLVACITQSCSGCILTTPPYTADDVSDTLLELLPTSVEGRLSAREEYTASIFWLAQYYY